LETLKQTILGIYTKRVENDIIHGVFHNNPTNLTFDYNYFH